MTDGNMTHGPRNGAMVSFSYDSRRRLTQAGTSQYVYDAENHRIGVNGTRFVVNSQPALSQVLVKTDADGAQTFYVYGLGLIGEESAAGYKAYHFDFRGSTVALSDASGALLERFSYSAYGVLLSGDATQTPFLFNGMYGVMTDGNGLYHMRARFYSAEIRRFLNRDVLLGAVAEGQTLNRFAFVTGMPVRFVDPLGLDSVAVQSNIQIPSFIFQLLGIEIPPPNGFHAGFAIEFPGFFCGDWNFAGYFGPDYAVNVGLGKATLSLEYSKDSVYDLKEGSNELTALLGTIELGASFDPNSGEIDGGKL